MSSARRTGGTNTIAGNLNSTRSSKRQKTTTTLADVDLFEDEPVYSSSYAMPPTVKRGSNQYTPAMYDPSAPMPGSIIPTAGYSRVLAAIDSSPSVASHQGKKRKAPADYAPVDRKPKPAPFPMAIRNTAASFVDAEATQPQEHFAVAHAVRHSRPAQTAEASQGHSRGRGTRLTAEDDPPVEKRPARFKPKTPKETLDRLERVRTQRFYMVDRIRKGEQLKEEFKVLGSTGNIYTLVIDQLPRCDCPDFAKGHHCKHILFIWTKVLQVPFTSHVWYQKGLLKVELQEVFANAPLAPNSVEHPRVREASEQMTGKKPAYPDAFKNKRIPQEDDECAVCYETMHGVHEAQLAACEQCGNNVHKQCFQQYEKTQRSTGKSLTCMYCRAPWPQAGEGGMPDGVRAGRYVNLGAVAGVSPVRDTSTYYHGPRRGQRHYGYNAYEDD